VAIVTTLPDTITEAEFLRVIDCTLKRHHKLAFILGFYACMRVSEIVHLQPGDVDRGQRLIRIKHGKGGKDRNIPIPPQAIKGLNTLPIKCGVRALQQAFNKHSLAALSVKHHFHTLRHSGATHYLNVKKWNIRQVQQLLGHARLDTTAIYTHVRPEELIDRMWGEG
jgi:integrase